MAAIVMARCGFSRERSHNFYPRASRTRSVGCSASTLQRCHARRFSAANERAGEIVELGAECQGQPITPLA
jgi:hypothetical protein